MPKLPPEVNGIMDLDEATTLVIQDKLQEIQSRPNLENEYGDVLLWDTFWTTATYNQENPELLINGDTCQYCLSYSPTEEESGAV